MCRKAFAETERKYRPSGGPAEASFGPVGLWLFTCMKWGDALHAALTDEIEGEIASGQLPECPGTTGKYPAFAKSHSGVLSSYVVKRLTTHLCQY